MINTHGSCCGNCKFWGGDVTYPLNPGTCHRYPPAFDKYHEAEKWPSVRLESWCGEWRSPEDPQKRLI